jgi:hypothetical protein
MGSRSFGTFKDLNSSRSAFPDQKSSPGAARRQIRRSRKTGNQLVEIVADRGVNAKVQRADWEEICRSMEADFRHGRYEPGVIRGVEQVTALLAAHFPARAGRNDELSGKTALL